MSIPQIELDDRRFQDLVNEARMRAGQACPEWTEHNVSDPGITLIELFAWMTEMLGYRLNRIPDKLHLALLELLGIQVAEPVAAATEVRFRLAAPAVEPVEIPAGTTEVGTIRTASEESIVFQTSYDFTVPPARPMAYLVERAGTPKNVGVAAGVARPKGGDQLAFDQPPKIGNALYLGFDTSLARLLLRVDVDCSQARGAGVDPEDPPLRFEVSDEASETEWSEATVLSDLTGGFNYGSGAIELQLPSRHSPRTIAGQRAYWVRCRLDGVTRSGAATARLHARARDLCDHGRPDRRRHPGGPLRAPSGRAARRERRLARAALPAALRAGARADAGRAPRGARARGRRGMGGLGAARVLRRERPGRPPLRARRRRRHDRARPRRALARREAGASTDACPRRARCCA